MCGRYFRKSDKQRIAHAFRIGVPPTFEILPSYNIAPASMQPVVLEDGESGEPTLRLMRWGVIPGWCDDPKNLGLSTINAKAETLLEKPLWRESFMRRRCLIPADGFYEWQKTGARTRLPWAFSLASGEPLAFAALWERWKPRSPADMPIEGFSIVTTEANELSAVAHNRMPVIVKPRDYARWLNSVEQERPPLDLLRPLDAALMRGWKIGPGVGSARRDGPQLLDPPPAVPQLFS